MAREFMCTKTEPVVETKAGKLRGFQLDGVYAFHGVKYADAKRFQQPTPPKPWEGIKNALAYGYVCPMLHQDEPNNELMVDVYKRQGLDFRPFLAGFLERVPCCLVG